LEELTTETVQFTVGLFDCYFFFLKKKKTRLGTRIWVQTTW